MHRIHYFLLLSISLFLLACSPKQLGQLRPTIELSPVSGLYSLFEKDFGSFLFKAHLQYGKKPKIGGLMIVKQTEPEVYRVIFMAEMGLSLFDFEFGKNGFIVHKKFELLDRKILLKIIENDIGLLLMTDEFKRPFRAWKSSLDSLNQVFTTHHEGSKHYYAYQDTSLRQIHQGGRVWIDINQYQNGFPQEITIQHKKLPLKIDLRLIRKK